MQLIERMLGSKTKRTVLSLLATNCDWEYSVTELSRDTETDKSLVSRAIRELENDNVIKTLTKGNVKLCRINMKNRIVRETVASLFDKEKGMAEELSKDIIKRIKPEKFTSVTSIILYGSLAKGTFTPKSDIDIMIVTQDQEEQDKIEKSLEEVSSSFLKEDLIVTVDVITEKELKKLFSDGEPAIADLVKSNKLLYGKDVRDII